MKPRLNILTVGVNDLEEMEVNSIMEQAEKAGEQKLLNLRKKQGGLCRLF